MRQIDEIMVELEATRPGFVSKGAKELVDWWDSTDGVLPPGAIRDLEHALREAGYPAWRVHVIAVRTMQEHIVRTFNARNG